MNHDLISRSAVIELIENCHVLEDAYCLIDYINELPAACDVDKVVKRLKEKAEYAESKAAEYDEKGDILIMDAWDREAKAYRNAIKIVKSSGATDE